MMKVFFAVFVCCMLCCGVFARIHNAVGILTKPLDDNDPSRGSYVGFTIVRYLQQQGLYVVPLIYDMDDAELAKLLPKLAGVLFTGGSNYLLKGTKYYETGRTIFEYSLSEGDKGRKFPIFGVCQGYELLSLLVADDPTVLEEGYDSYEYPIPLNFTAESKTSTMFGDAPEKLYQALQKQNLTLNNHELGITPYTYANNANLRKMFKVLSTNVDRNGRPFVSTIEARDTARYPIYATQWHPECSSWACSTEDRPINSPDGLEAALWVMRPFVEAARKSTNAFPSTDELYKSLIDRYPFKMDDEGYINWYFPQWGKN